MINFVPYHSSLAKHFGDINREWISDMFVLEQVDIVALDNPQETIIDKGGYIWFAEHSELGIIGTCALMNKGNGAFELTKMGVLSSARGLKVGEGLLKFVIAQAKELNISPLFLLTNKKCEAAIHLYEKNGFSHDKEIMGTYGKSYQRCDVAMRYTGD